MTTKFGSAQEIDQRLEKLGRQRELVHRIKKTGITRYLRVVREQFSFGTFEYHRDFR